MWGRRSVYLIALLGSLVFYGFYREWVSWVILLTVAILPWFSLLLSLPAMLTVKAGLHCPDSAGMGAVVHTALQTETKFPAPPVRGRIRMRNVLTGSTSVGLSGCRIPTQHCGVVILTCDRFFIYDYLGLFCRKLRTDSTCAVYILPKLVAASGLPKQADNACVGMWRPKPGGGFSEDHELRLYRPGDNLRQIHWKMTAKTGKLIYREPIEPVQKGYQISLTLTGSPKELDRKLGQLLWVSDVLLGKNLEHKVQCVTAGETLQLHIGDVATQATAIRTILSSTPAREEAMPEKGNALWQHHIGGDRYEA